MRNYSNILIELSHLPYLDSPANTLHSALDSLAADSSLHHEIERIAQVKKQTIEGRIADAYKGINELNRLPSMHFIPFEKVDPCDDLAYINYEIALFYRNVHDETTSSNYLKIAKLLVQSPDLELLIDYQFATNTAFRKSDISQLETFHTIFREKNIPVMQVMAQFRQGEILASKGDFTKSRTVFTDVQDFINDIPSNNLLITAKSNLGFVNYLDGNREEALAIYHQIEDCPDYYQRSLILENIALVHEAEGDYSTALTYWMDSLNLCQDHGVPVNIPEDSLRIGLIHEDHLAQPSQAKFFYKLGYDHSMTMFRDGINISGYMKEVIEKYISYFTDNYVPDEKAADRVASADPFSWALNQPWNDVINQFHYNLIVYHKFKCNSIQDMLDVLKLKRSNFQAKQQKLTHLGYHVPDFRKNAYNMDQTNVIDALQTYIHRFGDYDWKSIDDQFEKDILTYYLQKYGTKKETLVRKLKISYPNLSKKLKKMESD